MKEIEIISLFDNKIGVSGEETGTDWGRLFFFFFFFFFFCGKPVVAPQWSHLTGVPLMRSHSIYVN